MAVTNTHLHWRRSNRASEPRDRLPSAARFWYEKTSSSLESDEHVTTDLWGTMGKRRKRETPHAEGGHGPLTEARHQELLRSSPPEPSLEEVLIEDQKHAAVQGKRRLVEDREQHDEAEKGSEKRQMFEDARRENAGDAPIG